MGNNIIIVGAGGLGREVLWLLEELNNHKKIWNIRGFVDDNEDLKNSYVNDYPVLGNVDWLSRYPERMSVLCCIAKPKIRESIVTRLLTNDNLDYPNVVSESVKVSNRVKFGKGNIICMGTTLTVDIEFGDFNIINPSCTIGHDTKIDNYNTLYPGVNISGNVHLRNQVELGTGSQIIQGLTVCNDVIIGAGGVVIREIEESGTYVGVPIKKIK